MFFPDYPGPKSTAVLRIQNFSWIEAFHLGKASMYQAGATFFSFLTSLQKEKAWKIDWFWQIFLWIADWSHYLKVYIALWTSKSWFKAYGCSDLIILCLWAFCLILTCHQSMLNQAKQTIFSMSTEIICFGWIFQKVQSVVTLNTEHFCTAANIWWSHKQLIAGSSNGSCWTILLIGKLGSIAADPPQELLNLSCPRCFPPQYAYFL